MVLSFSSKENNVPEEKDDPFLSERAKEISWSAQKRLCFRYRLLIESGKNTKVACVAVARELVGYIWDIVCQEMPAAAK